MAVLDAKTGMPDPKVGKNGVVDLMEGLGFPLVPLAVDDPGPFVDQRHRRRRGGRSRARRGTPRRRSARTARSASIPRSGRSPPARPPSSIGDVIVVGSSHIHGYYPTRLRNLPGWIRGFDIRTGKQLWKFNLIPQKGEYGADTWKNGSEDRHAGRRQERRVGAVLGGSRSWGSSTSRSACRSATSTAAIGPATTSTATASSRST